MADSITRLYDAVLDARRGDPATSRTARLLQAGLPKASKKMAEEAIEVVIDAMNGHTEAVVKESADLIYNLVVLWSISGVRPADVWAEMQRRERLMGIAEKLPKKHPAARRKPMVKAATKADSKAEPKVVALEARRHRKRHR